MAMHFEELDDTRQHMLIEFEDEQRGRPYFGKGLSAAGVTVFPDLMRDAIRIGNEVSLSVALVNVDFWSPTETYVRNGVTRERQVNVAQAAERLAISEFNTWYVRGLARRLLHEKVERCQAYRAGQPKWEPGDCDAHEGQIYVVQDIYNAHRARYWPEPGNLSAVSIPFGPGCHHTIRRIS